MNNCIINSWWSWKRECIYIIGAIKSFLEHKIFAQAKLPVNISPSDSLQLKGQTSTLKPIIALVSTLILILTSSLGWTGKLKKYI